MATVTVVNAERTLEIEATSIVEGEVNASGHLILQRKDGTPIDVGAVSGMQLDQGTTYSKVDAFTYVGDTDPGAVPDGSVWLDTNAVAGPFASDTQKGLVEFATLAETNAFTDATRGVTPAGLAGLDSRLDALEVTKLQTLALNANTEAALPSVYPTGISLMTLGTSSGWSLNSGFGSVVTIKSESSRTQQTFYSNASSSVAPPRMWIRYGVSDNSGWTAWGQIQSTVTLTAASFTQTTALSGYPQGWSRLYYTTANSTNWDFTGSAGEVLTFVDGTDFAKQTFTKHVGGSATTEQWIRTATSAGGWTAWTVFYSTPGAWTSYTPVWSSSGTAPAIGNGVLIGRYSRVGRIITCHINLIPGSTTTYGTGNYSFTLPIQAANAGASYVGNAHLLGTLRWAGQIVISPNATTTSPFFPKSATESNVDFQTPTRPETFANGSQLRMTFQYEALT